jgi:hypothetical protein
MYRKGSLFFYKTIGNTEKKALQFKLSPPQYTKGVA